MWTERQINKRYLTSTSSITKIRIGTAILLINPVDEILLEKRSDCGWWGVPGGSVEVGETIHAAVIRETFEETGIKLFKKDLKVFGIYSCPKEGRVVKYPDQEVHLVDILFFVYLEKLPKVKISKESIEMRFFSKEKLKKLKYLVPPSREPIKEWIINKRKNCC